LRPLEAGVARAQEPAIRREQQVIRLDRAHGQRNGAAHDASRIGWKPGDAAVTRTEEPAVRTRVVAAGLRGRDHDRGQQRCCEEAALEHRGNLPARPGTESRALSTPHPAWERAVGYGLRVFSPGASATSARRESFGPVQKFFVSGYLSE